MLIIGSKALTYRFNVPDRIVKDIDIIGTYNDFKLLKNILKPEEVIEKEGIISLKNIIPSSLYPIFSTNNVEILLSDNSISLTKYLEYDNATHGIHYASPEVLFSIKKSHINFPIKFNKHIKDYSYLYNNLKGIDKLKDITKINFKETENRIGKLKTPSLNKTVKEFFNQSNDYVKSYFIHDHIHKVMAHYDKPLYEKMQYDLSFAKCEKELWEKFTVEEKCKCILEEVYVISLERRIIPMLFGDGKFCTSDEAFKWALMRVCTTLCSGWFRQFATDNYFKIIEYSNSKYVELFLKKYDLGEIQKIC